MLPDVRHCTSPSVRPLNERPTISALKEPVQLLLTLFLGFSLDCGGESGPPIWQPSQWSGQHSPIVLRTVHTLVTISQYDSRGSA